MDTAVMKPPTMLPAAGNSYLKIVPPTGLAALNLRDVWRFRDLLMALAGRDVKLRYKQTALGVVWVVLQPLIAAGVFSFVFGKLGKLPHGTTNSFVYSYVGLLGFNLFSGTLSKTSGCLIGNSALISKIFFPRLVLPFSVIPSVLIDFSVALMMLVVLMIVFRVSPTFNLLLLPYPIILLLMLSMGFGLITAALTVSYRDVQYILPVLLQILLYASPVAYPLTFALSNIPAKWQPFYLLNPLAASLEAFKAALLGTPWPSLDLMVYASSTAVIFLLAGAYSFKKMERKFADVI